MRLLPRLGSAIARPVVLPFDLLAKGFIGAVLGVHRFLQRGVLRQLALIVLLVGVAVWGAIRLMPATEYLPGGNRNLTRGKP